MNHSSTSTSSSSSSSSIEVVVVVVVVVFSFVEIFGRCFNPFLQQQPARSTNLQRSRLQRPAKCACLSRSGLKRCSYESLAKGRSIRYILFWKLEICSMSSCTKG